jgi:hypothetical protein
MCSSWLRAIWRRLAFEIGALEAGRVKRFAWAP